MGAILSAGATAVIPPTTPWADNAAANSASYVDVYTVPAGKTLYVTSIFISTDSGTTDAVIRIDSTDVYSLTVQIDSFYPLNGSASSPLLSLPANSVLKIRTNAGGFVSVNFAGFLL